MNTNLDALLERKPEFSSHEEARSWFKEQLQEQFQLRSSDEVNGKRVYFYHIIKNPEVYKSYMESFASPVKHEITSMEPFESYTTLEISEDGGVRVSL
ncbi:hypothetical protein [Bacillus sp. FJAT-27251]|uniref:hypothetical protein n=1 Tax=Bacillus sp. FJAT-27251 TaxID=1684142 RepID=UPI0006A7E97F|nr:hypothetical protein [Bacillus sp. FJAT-27251]